MDFHLLPEERLRVLQANDPRRRWHSLDDQRVCVLCGRTITGRQVLIKRESGGQYSLHCPTEGCEAVPRDWFYQGSAYSNPTNATVRTSEASVWSASISSTGTESALGQGKNESLTSSKRLQ